MPEGPPITPEGPLEELPVPSLAALVAPPAALLVEGVFVEAAWVPEIEEEDMVFYIGVGGWSLVVDVFWVMVLDCWGILMKMEGSEGLWQFTKSMTTHLNA